MRIYAVCILSILACLYPTVVSDGENVTENIQIALHFAPQYTVENIQAYRALLADLQKSSATCDLPQKEGPRFFSGPAGVEKMTEPMLALVFQVHKQLLTDDSFVQHVAGMIEHDNKDVESVNVVPTEWGGLGTVGSTIEFLPIPSQGRYQLIGGFPVHTEQLSLSSQQQLLPNESYALPDWAKRIPHVCEFHIHTDPFDKHGDTLCRPSYFEEDGAYKKDLGVAINSAIGGVPHNHIIFAKLPNRTFSVVYFGSDVDEQGNWFVVVISLENVSYQYN